MHHEHGQSVIEFLVVTVFVALGLLAPWLDGRSPAELLLSAFAELATSQVAWIKII